MPVFAFSPLFFLFAPFGFFAAEKSFPFSLHTASVWNGQNGTCGRRPGIPGLQAWNPGGPPVGARASARDGGREAEGPLMGSVPPPRPGVIRTTSLRRIPGWRRSLCRRSRWNCRERGGPRAESKAPGPFRKGAARCRTSGNGAHLPEVRLPAAPSGRSVGGKRLEGTDPGQPPKLCFSFPFLGKTSSAFLSAADATPLFSHFKFPFFRI